MRCSIPSLLLVVAGCASPRPLVTNARSCVAWKDDVSAIVNAQCVACHAGPDAAAGYRLDDYFAAIDRRVVTAGDASSPLLLVLEATSPAHAGLDALAEPTLRQWVVDCALAYSPTPIHPHGFLDPASADFHGAAIAASGYRFGACQQCHGDDFAGGKAQASCTTCHAEGPTACGTCHAMPPATGAHAVHADAANLGKRFDCVECHAKPDRFDAPGHIDGKAAVTFAGSVLSRGGAFQASDGSCSVACHAGATPRWTNVSSVTCESCHGSPPRNHASDRCTDCHGDVAADGGTALLHADKHLDGAVQLGDGSGSCIACHGDAGQPPTSGAHASHVLASHALSRPLACETCHRVPSALGSAGHIDSPPPAEVFPAGVTGLAFADSATPSWDTISGGCTSYCHGSGAALGADPSPGILRTPNWRQASSDARQCGACHGLPPPAPVHYAADSLATCVECHPDTVDEAGAIIAGGQHIDGRVEWRPR